MRGGTWRILRWWSIFKYVEESIEVSIFAELLINSNSIFYKFRLVARSEVLVGGSSEI